jgi:hypothetical protein
LSALRHQPHGIQNLTAGAQHVARWLVQWNDAIAVGGIEQIFALNQTEGVATKAPALP